MQKITPYLWFDNQARQAAQLYTSVFQDGRITSGAPNDQGNDLVTTFSMAGQDFAGINGGPLFSFTPAISFFVYCETEAQIDALWAALIDGGHALMEFGPYPFSEKFGWLADRFGVSWQLSLVHQPQRIVPFFMFTGAQFGKAEQAIRQYIELFSDSRISHLQHVDATPQQPESSLQMGIFSLAGQEFIAIDSAVAHGFTFNEAISFLIDCDSQDEVDFFWDHLSQGGETSQCGWLKDRFGVSWQVVPRVLMELMRDPDAERARRVTEAMLKMTKIDIETLRQA